MNRTDTIKAHKLSDSMVTALESMSYREHDAKREGHTGYHTHAEIHPRTRKALHDRGLMMGHYYLTPEGLDVLNALTGTVAIQETVTIQGEYVEAPDAFGHMAEQEAARIIADGGCVGLCAVGTGCEHCDEQYGEITPQTDAESVQEESESMDKTVKVIAVVQNVPGMTGETHYHTPECRDVTREMRRWGQKGSDTYTLDAPSVAFLLSDFEDGGRGSDYAEENTPEWWTVVVENAGMESVKIMSCLRDKLPAGFTTQGAPILMSGGYITGIGDVPDAPKEKGEKEIAMERAEERFPIGSHVQVKDDAVKRVGAVSGHVKGYSAAEHTSPGSSRPWFIPAAIVERGDGSTRVILTGDLEPYTPGASESTNAISGSMDDLATRSTGTTHHSVDTEGQSWVRFDHVLSVGDVVQSTDSNARGIFKVYALIPGLPVVYVDPCDGREPFPVGATKLYAL